SFKDAGPRKSFYDFPLMLDRIRKQWLGAWAGFVTQHAGRVLWPAILAAVTTVCLSIWGMPLGGGRKIERLGFQSDRNQLISPELDWNKRFIRWQQTFEGIGDLYVVVDV